MELNQCENPSSDAQRGKAISSPFGAWQNKVVCVEIWVLHLSMTFATDSKSDLDGWTFKTSSGRFGQNIHHTPHKYQLSITQIEYFSVPHGLIFILISTI